MPGSFGITDTSASYPELSAEWAKWKAVDPTKEKQI